MKEYPVTFPMSFAKNKKGKIINLARMKENEDYEIYCLSICYDKSSDNMIIEYLREGDDDKWFALPITTLLKDKDFRWLMSE